MKPWETGHLETCGVQIALGNMDADLLELPACRGECFVIASSAGCDDLGCKPVDVVQDSTIMAQK